MARTITTGGSWSLDQGPDTKLPILTQVDSIYTIVGSDCAWCHPQTRTVVQFQLITHQTLPALKGNLSMTKTTEQNQKRFVLLSSRDLDGFICRHDANNFMLMSRWRWWWCMSPHHGDGVTPGVCHGGVCHRMRGWLEDVIPRMWTTDMLV